MDESQMADAPAGQEAQHDPEIIALLEFEPVPRKRIVEGGWTPELQREFIARLAEHGSPGRACEDMGKNLTGMTKLYRSPLAASFRAAWHGAIALAKQRQAQRTRLDYVAPGTMPPSIDHRRKQPSTSPDGALDVNGQPQLPGQVRNEHGEWEDEASFRRRGEEAGENIAKKLLRLRRFYLAEISRDPGKRAAFEILTELPIDWEIAGRGEPQPDEPWHDPNQRQPENILFAESGWPFGELGYGPDRKAEARRMMDDYREARGLPPIDWSAGDDSSPLMGEAGRG
jgi:hypothetical protein